MSSTFLFDSNTESLKGDTSISISLCSSRLASLMSTNFLFEPDAMDSETLCAALELVMEAIGAALTLMIMSVRPLGLSEPDPSASNALCPVLELAMEAIGAAFTVMLISVFPVGFSEPDASDSNALCAILKLAMDAIDVALTLISISFSAFISASCFKPS